MPGPPEVATDPKEVEHIRGLGFIGLLVNGSKHQPLGSCVAGRFGSNLRIRE
jgi:hypothetical protein